MSEAFEFKGSALIADSLESPAHRIITLIPAYNPRRNELLETLRSALNQTCKGDILIVDDGSAVPVTSPIPDEPLIHVLRMQQNVGITEALRAGVQFAIDNGYEYIARLDVGDYNHPDRLERQAEYMSGHPEIDLLGARSRVVDPDGRHLYDYGVCGSPRQMRNALWRNSIFRHSTFFIRVSALKRFGNYDPGFKLAQDYEMLVRFSQHGQIACLPDTLIDYVDDPSGLTMKKRGKQLRMRLKAQLQYAKPLNIHWYVGIVKTLVTMTLPRRLAKIITSVIHNKKSN